MPLETPPRLAAERLLLLTESVNEAILNDRFEELPGLFESRRAVLDQLASCTLDAPSLAILERVAQAESDLSSLLERSRTTISQELAGLFSGTRQVKAYSSPSSPKRLLRTG